jgi:hypothetical protein
MEFNEAFSPVRAVAHGASALRRAPLSVLVGSLSMVFLGMCSGGGGGGDLSQIAEDQSPEALLALAMVMVGVMAVGMVVSFFAFLARCFVLPGWIRVQRHVIEHGTENLGLLFTGGDTMLRMVGWSFLDGLIRFGTLAVAAIPGAVIVAVGFSQGSESPLLLVGLLVMLLCAIPVGVYVSLGLHLGSYAVTLEGLGPIEALDRSWSLARGNRITLLLFTFVTGFVAALGLLLCGVGFVATSAIAKVGTTEAFLLATLPEAKDYVIPREEGL